MDIHGYLKEKNIKIIGIYGCPIISVLRNQVL